MGERILTIVILAVGSVLLAYATLGRLCGIHRPLKWTGGGRLTFFAEICIAVFVLCIGLTVVFDSAAWAIPALGAWIGGFISQQRTRRRFLASEGRLRKRNSADYPGVFDTPPPTDIDATNDVQFELFDAGACTHLGRITKDELKKLIEEFAATLQEGPNDLFMLQESLEIFPDGLLSDKLAAILEAALNKRDYLVLRWVPSSKASVEAFE